MAKNRCKHGKRTVSDRRRKFFVLNDFTGGGGGGGFIRVFQKVCYFNRVAHKPGVFTKAILLWRSYARGFAHTSWSRYLMPQSELTQSYRTGPGARIADAQKRCRKGRKGKAVVFLFRKQNQYCNHLNQ